ncbi:hypothetical protein CP965_12090 [Halarcobacter mediterraneus]|uniref:DUF2914 domain-containing protein n=1 Tax=Halarcobacter mediterraneus TaxID=2023153 RepID=A0A4Q1B0D2_9BACT|nr:hypothetical protein [Halarcobacter mediterraneus]RXK11914.1 hypothetical protein CP965_12090 [Halarcobacter mediterraneus]
MKKVVLISLFIFSTIFAETIDEDAIYSADCLILEDENSIVCKYTHERSEEDKEIQVQWIDPTGNISRDRTLIIPAGHGSIYDFRYIAGRTKGIWQFKVVDNKRETIATFEIK